MSAAVAKQGRRATRSTFRIAAEQHVAKHARYTGLKYAVRYPLAASAAFVSTDTEELVVMVAKEMEARANAPA